ncbi:MAG TPA: response regulator transcription factor [Steroidobacteraceae bacterium]|jgi:DNA-binding NarL/FixJ family response regulator|nr:response regulator transcription factor [Steroidobacteraceae bacterium]
MDPEPAAPIRIVVVDDHGIVRDGLCALLDGHFHMKVIGAVATGQDAVLCAQRLNPDVIVMDLVLPDLNGIDATARILASAPRTRIVILSTCDTSEHIVRALRAGALGYVLKESASGELVQAVLAVSAGERYLSQRITGLLIDALLGDAEHASPIESLSAREREVLVLTVGGASSAEIGQKLSLSRKTVDTYRSRTMEKLGVPDLAGLIRFAIAHAMAPA